MKACRLRILALLLLVVLPARAPAQELVPPLPVRKDALRPGWFFVGVVPGTPKTAPIVVEIRAGGTSSPARRFRSPDARAFDLCTMLRTAGLASQPGALHLNVTRGPGSFAFTISYDGKRCAGSPVPETPSAARREPGPALEPLRLGVSAAPAAPTPPAEPADRVAQVSPAPSPRAEPPAPPERDPETVRVPDEPVPVPTPPTRTAEPAPARVPVGEPVEPVEPAVATAPAVTPAERAAEPSPGPAGRPAEPAVTLAAPSAPVEPELSLGPPAASAASSLSASQRGLTVSNLEWMRVFLERNVKLKTQDYRVELRFRTPVNIEGIETAAILKAIAVVGRPKEFLDVGSEHILDPPEDPRAASWVSFSVPESLAIETPAVNHLVFIRLRIGELPDAVFETETGIRRRKGP